jgi:hypothetical protein
MKQLFYCFGMGFYNYSQIELLEDEEQKYQMNQNALHYYNIINE